MDVATRAVLLEICRTGCAVTVIHRADGEITVRATSGTGEEWQGSGSSEYQATANLAKEFRTVAVMQGSDNRRRTWIPFAFEGAERYPAVRA